CSRHLGVIIPFFNYW
nr:immunoglobulin heavy chain junction region [Macaca mulatta]MOW47895.1 immunoglobulin heavy chain junction region [Macaca mulatta]MOW49959.1 immunoglobulin heavy chain junction region [Macaca mulatta]